MHDDAIDEIGSWSEVKLEIIKEYGTAYSKIFHGKKQSWARHMYIDAFSGPGVCISRETKKFVAGSPLNALLVKPPFREFHLIDIDGAKIEILRETVKIASKANEISPESVVVYEGDCNEILIKHLFPMIIADNRRRALCILDPYKLQLRWEIILAAGASRHIDLFLNFPIMVMNRGVLWHDPKAVSTSSIEYMNTFWGDASWRDIAYGKATDLFGEENDEKKSTNWQLALAFKERLKRIAGFRQVPDPMPMRNSRGAIVYYLFFASQKSVAMNIVKDIFKKYRNVGLK
jgi:three-Cys-motif partner protein